MPLLLRNALFRKIEGLVVIVVFIIILQGFVLHILSLRASNHYGGDDFECVMTMKDRPTIADMFSISKRSLGTGYNTYYMPLSGFVFSSIYTLFDGNRLGFVYFNYFFHYLDGILIYVLLLGLSRRPILSVFFSSFFLLYKPNLQTLNWLSAGMERSFSMFLVLTSLIFFNKYFAEKKIFFYMMSLALCSLAYLMKPISYFFPVTLVFFYLYMVRSSETKAGLRRTAKQMFLFCAPFFILLIPFIAISMARYPEGNVARSWGGVSIGVHTLLRSLDLISYIIIPSGMPVKERGLLMMGIFAGSLVLCAYGVIKNKMALMGGLSWLWLGVMVTAGSNFRPTPEVLRYLYLPIGGFIIIASSLAQDLMTWFDKQKGPIK